MKQTKLDLEQFGLQYVESKKFLDERGTLKKVYHSDSNLKKDLPELKEVFFTFSKKGTIRGMHLQGPVHEMQKLIMVVDGLILDLIVDCNIDSENYGTYKKVELDKNSDAIFIPNGFAHGFQVLSDIAIVMYGTDADFCSKCDTGFNYDSLKMEWPIEDKIISKKDLNLIDFNNFDYSIEKSHS
jgi:dTDP-4-dehydrorhamnose 3,5-epimerase